jgi:glutaredoxin 3
MEIETTENDALAEVEIYSSPFCGFCYRAKRLLEDKGIEFTEFNVFADAAKRREMTDRAGGNRKVPQIFIDGEHIGGCDELYRLELENRLDTLLGLETGS